MLHICPRAITSNGMKSNAYVLTLVVTNITELLYTIQRICDE